MSKTIKTFSSFDAQTDFIVEDLTNTISLCNLNDTNNINKISTKIISEILNKKFINGSDMKAILCMLDKVFLSLSDNDENINNKILPRVDSKINNWITKANKLPVSSSEGYVYISDILSDEAQVIIKVPQTNDGTVSMLTEYYIGIKAVNKLRYILPTFVYTLGAFVCPIVTPEDSNPNLCINNTDNTSYVIYEKINGDTVGKLLQTKELDFNQWLNIFSQLLLSLEVAQREINFTHFDLHIGNVMVRKARNTNYNVLIHDKEYQVNTDIFPVIIDFGMATSCVNSKTIGSYDFPKYGMLNYMIPGYDMYKFLVFSYSYSESNDKLRKQIRNIFKIISDIDPYNIYKNPLGLSTALNEYCAKATFSDVGKLTPIRFFNLLKKEYPQIISNNIKITDRKQYFKVQYSSLLKTYDDIFNSKESIKNVLEIAHNCLKTNTSYIITKYNVHVMSRYNQILKSKEFEKKISYINTYIEGLKKSIQLDKIILEKVFDIPIPTQKRIDGLHNSILEMTFDSTTRKKKVKNYEKYKDIISYEEKLEPYLQFYYTIQELNLDDIYSDWLNRFKTSKIYKIYIHNAESNDIVLRWCLAMIGSIQMNTWERDPYQAF